jgi:hypothetical protein
MNSSRKTLGFADGPSPVAFQTAAGWPVGMCQSIRLLCVLGVLSFGMVGCRSAPRVSIIASGGANHDNATRLDFVVVRDTGLLPMIPRDSAAWFARKDAIVSALGKDIRVVSLEVPPHTVVDSVAMPVPANHPASVLYFAAYAGPSSQTSGAFSPDRDVTLHLEADTVVLSFGKLDR